MKYKTAQTFSPQALPRKYKKVCLTYSVYTTLIPTQVSEFHTIVSRIHMKTHPSTGHIFILSFCAWLDSFIDIRKSAWMKNRLFYGLFLLLLASFPVLHRKMAIIIKFIKQFIWQGRGSRYQTHCSSCCHSCGNNVEVMMECKGNKISIASAR